ncbi:MAG: hypothetical protein HY243_12365 [Proteobacteria bacterium]|nr:hypothetical protein [Pseudomonadota bacterium]
MSPDKVEIKINGLVIAGFLGYVADSNVLIPADVCTFRLAGIVTEFKKFQQFQLYVNGLLEMTGIIDTVEQTYQKGSAETTITGRDLMGLVVDSTIMPKSGHLNTLRQIRLVKELAVRLLKDVPFINQKNVVYAHELPKSQWTPNFHKPSGEVLAGVAGAETSEDAQLEPGETIFKVLSDLAQRRGLLFWCEPDGTFVFGTLKGKSAPAVFNFYCVKPAKDGTPSHLRALHAGISPGKNNVLRAQVTDDGSKQFSVITTAGQQDVVSGVADPDYNLNASASDSTVPFYKPTLLMTEAPNQQGCKEHAEWEIKKRAANSWRLEYTVSRHSQNGVNYRANTVCHIHDDLLGLNGNYLILGRKFSMDKNTGQTTLLTIGPLAEGYTIG